MLKPMRAVYRRGLLHEKLFRAADGTRVPWSKRLTFIAGLGLIAASFLVYLAYPLIFLLASGSAIAKIVISVAAWVLSWSSFTGGLLLAGLGQSKRFRSFLRRKNNAPPTSIPQDEAGGAPQDSSPLN